MQIAESRRQIQKKDGEKGREGDAEIKEFGLRSGRRTAALEERFT